jgi:hypothetical protein
MGLDGEKDVSREFRVWEGEVDETGRDRSRRGGLQPCWLWALGRARTIAGAN